MNLRQPAVAAQAGAFVSSVRASGFALCETRRVRPGRGVSRRLTFQPLKPPQEVYLEIAEAYDMRSRYRLALAFIYRRSMCMIEAGLNKRLAIPLPDPHSKDFYFAFGVASLALLLHTYTLIAEFARAHEVESLILHAVPPFLLIIEFCLLVSVAGLLIRNVAGLLISLLALVVTNIGYVIWYLASRPILEMLSAPPFYQLYAEAVPPHPLGLLGATTMNVLVLALSGVLLIWEAKTLRSMLQTFNKAHTKP